MGDEKQAIGIDVLRREIKDGKVRSLYLFYGVEDYLKKYYLELIEKTILTGEFRELNRVVLEGKKDIKEIIDNCETLPVFSERKIIIVKDSGYFKQEAKDAAAEKKKSRGDGLIAYLQNIPEHICLVFVEKEVDKRLKIVDAVKKNGLLVEFDYLKPADLTKLVVKKFASFGKEIDMRTASMLVEYCEPGMDCILAEIEKIALYLGDKKRVEIPDIEVLCTRSAKSRIFDLTDAVAKKDLVKALKILDDMFVLKEPFTRILVLIARQFRQILEAKLMFEEGMPVVKIAERMGVTSYIAGKILQQARAFTVKELTEAIKQCLAADEAIKSGKMDNVTAITLLVAEAAG